MFSLSNVLDFRRESRDRFEEIARKRQCAQVNEQAAGQALQSLSDAELAAHIDLLDAEHQMKQHALQRVADALSRALIEKWQRRQA